MTTLKARAITTVLATIALVLGAVVAPAQATTSSLLTVDLTGVFNDGDATRSASRSVAVGTVSSGWKSDGSVQTSNYGFNFSANCATVGGASTCAALTGAGATLYWHWDFGDGRTRTTTAPTPGAQVTYTKAGTYTVRVTVNNTPSQGAVPADSYAGTAELRVVVAPRFADVDASNGTKRSPTNAESMWAVSALGLLEPCGVYLPAQGQSLANSTEGDPGRALFCPKAPAVNGVAASPTVAPFTTNGVTGTNCLSSSAACGLPASAWANNGLALNATCTAACVTELTSRGFLNSSGAMLYRNDVCADNRTSVAYTTTAARGTENGCVTYGDFLAGLGRALDGAEGSQDAELTTTGACVAAAPASVKRAHKLISGSPAATNRSGLVRMCNLDAAITKAEAYALVAAATGTSLAQDTAFLAGFRDMRANSPLASGTYSSSQQGEVLSGIADAGAPVVGNLECADRARREADQQPAGVCFNGGESLFRDDASRLLAWLVLGENARTSDTRAEVTPAAAVTTSGRPISVDVKAYVPAWYPTTSAVTVSWTGGSALNTVTCPTYSAVVGGSRTATIRCVFTGANETGQTGQTFTATVRDDQGGNQATATFRAVVSNDAPVIGEPTIAADNEGDTMNISVPIDEPQGGLVRVGVRSCLPARDGGCVTTANTFPRNGNKTRTTTSDTNAATFADTAATDVGTVRVRDVTASTARLVVDPYDSNNNGSFDFVVQVCDSGNSCTNRYVRPTYRPVNDRPRTGGLIAATADAAGVDITLRGTDDADTGQPGYPNPSNPIGQYMLCNIPSGWNAFWVDGSSTTLAVSGAPSTSNRVRLVPQNGTPKGTYALRYNVRDNGQGPTPGDFLWAGGAGNCSGNLGDIQVTSTADWPGSQIGATVTPSTVPAHTGQVTMNVSDLSPGAAITVNWGDGTTTGPVNSTSIRHVYTSGADTNYTVTYSVTEAGQTYNGVAGNVYVRANHVSEPTFETSAYQGWTSTGGALATVAGAGRSSSIGLRLTGTPNVNTENDVYLARGRVVAGESYQLRLWVRAASARTATVTLAEVDGASSTAAVNLTTGWQEVVRTLPAASRNGSSLVASITGASGADVFVDDVSVTGTLSSSAAFSFSQTVMESKPYAYFPLTTDDTDDLVLDASANGRDAKNAGTFTLKKGSLVAGGSGKAVVEPGNELRLGLGRDLAREDGDKATVSFWVDKPAEASWSMRTSKAGAGTRLAAASDQGLTLGLGSSVEPEAWDHLGGGRHHVVAVLTAGEPAKTRLYVDGNELDHGLELSGAAVADLSVDSVRLSVPSDSEDAVVIDEVAVFAGALSPVTISRHFAAGATGDAAVAAADRPALTVAGSPASRSKVNDPVTFETVLKGKPTAGRLFSAGKVRTDVVGKNIEVVTADGALHRAPLRGLNTLGRTSVVVVVTPSRVRVFVNGASVPVDSTQSAKDISGGTDSKPVRVRVPKARVDEGAVVRVYDRALPSAAVQRHYTAAVAKGVAQRAEKAAQKAGK